MAWAINLSRENLVPYKTYLKLRFVSGMNNLCYFMLYDVICHLSIKINIININVREITITNCYVHGFFLAFS